MLRRLHGFTLIELLVVIIIISTLGAVLLDRVLFYQEAAEKAAMEQLAGTLRSGLHLQIADRLLKGKTADIAALGQDNPMDWLAEQPANYVGVRFAPQAGEVAKGNWYYDLKDRQLVYVVARGGHFAPNKQGRKEVRYAVRVVYARAAQAGRENADKQEVNGVILAMTEPYRWF
ncbi:MAG: prepilin-type N-terminal cleavage/methylation domain-containing protein [Burkholderiales bacterium]|nr:prepilin-type N-terminal cleavage/methylation domain-containing protein [Burkholderiales bacterium]